MADTEMYRGDDEISVPEELVSAMTGRGWSTAEKNAGENHPPIAPDSTPEGAPEGTTTEKNAGENHPPVAPDSTPEGAPAGTTKAQRSR